MLLAERRRAGSRSPFLCGLDTLITRRFYRELGMASDFCYELSPCQRALSLKAQPPTLFLLGES